MANLVQIVISALDQTKDVFTKTIGGLNDIGKAADIAAGAMVGAGVAAAGAFTAMVGQAIRTSDEIGKQAQKVGLMSERWSELRHAAESSNVGSEEMIAGLKTLSGQLQQVQAGSEQASKLFNQLGVSALDSQGNIRQLDEVLTDVAQSFADHADGAQKAAIASDLFGKAGINLIPMLNGGRDGLKSAADEAREFGLVVGSEASKNAADFNDNISRLTSVLTGLARTVAAEMLPSLVKFSELLVSIVRDSNLVSVAAKTMVDVFNAVSSAVTALFLILKSALTYPALLVNMILQVAKTFSDFASGVAYSWSLIFSSPSKANQAMSQTVDAIGTNLDTIKQMYSGASKTIAEDMEKAWKLIASPVTPDAPILGPPAPPGFGVDKTSKLNFRPPIDEKVLEKNAENAQKLQDAIARMWHVLASDSARARGDERAAEDAKLQEQLAQIDKLGAGEDEYYALREAAFLNHEQRLTEIKKAENDKRAELIGQLFEIDMEDERQRRTIREKAVQGAYQMFGDMATAAKAFGKKGFAAYKVFASGQALIATYSSAVKAYDAMAGIPFVGPALGIAAAAAAIAAGLANVAQINSTNPAGSAHAGLSYVPAESTYVLNQGERVLAPRQNTDLTSFLENNNGSGGGGMMHMIVNLDGRAILDYIGEATRNGTVELDARAVV